MSNPTHATDCEFDWDDNKAATNLQKHGVDFVEAMTVLADPLAMTFFDAEHSLDVSARRVAAGHPHIPGHRPEQCIGSPDLCPAGHQTRAAAV
jgi:hypothetical protein